ncbi:advillin [Gadus macrocephalus]|uniref:advillin n=1 Tax=Gadus macrocephalus TaxID=80720 RepID=UPI0028CB3DC7|nr:advillin [Gadus macrocephalus]
MEYTFRAVTHNPGLLIWRIEKMELVLVNEKSHGNFYEGDCYILLSTQKSGATARYDIHYWIGSASSQDEQGAAVIYTVQLDDFLGSSPVQHREVQNHESDAFRGYFKNGIICKKGGVASGMRHTETNSFDVERLLHVKGRKRVMAMEVEMSWESFNLGDVFLLDVGKTIVQWNGPKSNRQERLKGMLLAKDIRDRERGGRTDILLVDGDAEGGAPVVMDLVEGVLGKRTSELKAGAPDEKADQEQKSKLVLYKVSDDGGSMKVTEVAATPLVQDLMNHEDCYIVDQGGSKIFVWKGKKASKAERQAAMSRALEFIKVKDYPAHTNVETVNDGAESALFKQLFQSWTVKDQTQGLGRTNTRGKVAFITQETFDAAQMHLMPEVAAQQRMVDNGSGDVEVWRIEDLELVAVQPEWQGYFFGGDCYLILYTYLVNSKQHFILYMWQGRHATTDELAASAFQAVALDQKYGGEPVQIRVPMGKESKHFMSIFKGRMVIFEGGTSRTAGTDPEPPVRLFQVRGSDPSSTKATEVSALASSLNSNDVFLLKSQSGMFLWCGKGSSGDERNMARQMSTVIGKGSDSELEVEGQESVEFWSLLGGKAPYASDKRLQQLVPDHPPRLFECSNQTGRFMAEEISQFNQDDLSTDDVMLLDTWDQVFIWVGQDANDTEKKEVIPTSRDFLRTHPGGRDPDTPIILIKQGFEPPTFTGWFAAWDPFKWSGGNSYEEMRKELGDSAPVPVQVPSSVEQNGGAEEEANYDPHPAEELLHKQSSELPEGVDPAHKEKYLSDADFQEIFQLSKGEFVDLPAWKRLKLKKEKGLF